MELITSRRLVKWTKTPDGFAIKHPDGASFPFLLKEEEIDLSAGAASNNKTLTSFIPDGAYVFAMTARVTVELVSGGDRTTFNIGETSGGSQYYTTALTAQKLAVGTTFTMRAPGAATLPKQYTANQDVNFSATGGTTGNWTSGKVKVVVLYLLAEAPEQ